MTELERFKNEVNEAIIGIDIVNDTNEIKVCDTPEILIKCGLNPLPMLYRKGHLRDAIKNKNRKFHFHGITLEQIFKMPEMIANPALIIKNCNKQKEFPILVFDEIDQDKMPLFLMVDMNTKGNYDLKQIDTNEILSLYGREKFFEYFKNIINENRLVYYNKEKVQKLDTYSEQCLLTMCKVFEPNKILQKFNNDVKLNSSEKISS